MPATTAIRIGPADNGQPMSLAEFEHAEVEEGYLYELGRGVIVVSDVPKPEHFAQVNAIRKQLVAYDLAHPEEIYGIAGGAECKVLVEVLQSERHPDLAVYKTPPPLEDDSVWSIWVPELVIEVMSPSSRSRDLHEKPDEYLAFGVKEYWIVDAKEDQVLVLQRARGKWREQIIEPPQIYRPALFPGLAFDCRKVFAAVKKPKRRRS